MRPVFALARRRSVVAGVLWGMLLFSGHAAALSVSCITSAPYGIWMRGSLIGVGGWTGGEGGPFADPTYGSTCGAGISSYSWNPTIPEAAIHGAADGADGTVRAGASTLGAIYPATSAAMSVAYWDTLTFSADADIVFSWHFDGHIDAERPGSYTGGGGVSMAVNLGPTFGWTYNDDRLGDYDLTASTTVHVTAGQGLYVELGLSAKADSYGIQSDFGHTGRMAIDLPAGVAFTSASGTFLSAAPATVPEPPSLVLAALGIAALGAASGRAGRRMGAHGRTRAYALAHAGQAT